MSLNEEELKQIARATGAQYFSATDETELLDIYENLSTKFVMEKERTEITAFAVCAALLALLAGGAFSLAWFSRLP